MNDDPLRWLVELRDHLVPAVEVLNARGEAILPAARSDTSTRLRRLVIAPLAPAVEALLRDAGALTPVAFAHISGLRVAATGLHDETGEPLTLLLAERADAGRDAVRRGELERVAAWLSRALARSRLAGAPDPGRDWHELSVLHRMLNKAVAGGSVRAVVEAYVEALAIWAAVDTRAYIGDRSGRFVLDVALAGADRAAAPRVIAGGDVEAITGLTALDTSLSAHLGFTTDVETVFAPVRDQGTASWLMAYQGAFRPFDRERLALFHDMLLPALHAAGEVEASRLMWSMTQRLVAEHPSLRDAALEALGELEQAGLCTAAMLVLRRGGQVLLSLGTPAPDRPDGQPWPAPARQAFTLDVPAPFEASLTMWRPVDRPFTGREARLGAIGASVLGSWAAAALRRGDMDREASAAPNERRQGRAATAEVSLLVIRPERPAAPDARELWVGEIRRRLRPADVTGALATGEIGVLLPGTAADDAHAVASRLRRVFAQHSSLDVLERAPIGIATARSRASDGYTLLQQARAHADSAEPPAPPSGG